MPKICQRYHLSLDYFDNGNVAIIFNRRLNPVARQHIDHNFRIAFDMGLPRILYRNLADGVRDILPANGTEMERMICFYDYDKEANTELFNFQLDRLNN